jgi:3-oxoacyl-[acyl-carrier protein] reductase
MDFGLNGKIAIVTGGGSGIAKGTVETFLREGVKVVTADRDVSPLAGLEVEAIELDLLDP